MNDTVDSIQKTCTVSWCGNKCHLYNAPITYDITTQWIVINSLREDGHCSYRPTITYIYPCITTT
jgi:hypothetical protein